MSAAIRAGVTLLLHLCLVTHAFSQTNINDELMRGDKQFDLYAYKIAIQTYQSVLKADPNNAYALARVGDCYMQLNNPEEAVKWYARAVAQPGVEPDVFGRYGKAVMQTGDYTTAKTWFEKWSSSDAANARRYIEMCDYALQTINMEPLYKVRSEGINSPSTDFGPAFFGNRLIYSSSRTDIPRRQVGKSASDWSGSAYNQLFITQINPKTKALQNPAYFQSDLSNQFNEGPVSFSADGKKIALCKNNFIDGSRQLAAKGINMSLFLADMKGDNWENAKAFPYNGSDYSTGYPALSQDGKTLYFASDRPGGQGGWDVYVSRFENGQWSQPVNLGAPLNTPGNEISPFFDGQSLFFASDWHRGYGGLDIFKATLDGDRARDVKHTGPGINSPRDDYGLTIHPSQKTGFFASNRVGSRGAEDLYSIALPGGAAPATVAASTAGAQVDMHTPASETQADIYTTATEPAGRTVAAPVSDEHFLLVTDATNKPLEGVSIDLRDCNGAQGVTDAQGKYYFTDAAANKDCAVLLRKLGYQDRLLELKDPGTANLTAIMSPDARRDYRGVVHDAKTKKPLSETFLSMQVPETGAEVQAQTNAKGEYVLYLSPGKQYALQVAKTGYETLTTTVKPASGTTLQPIYLQPTGSKPAASAYTQTATATTAGLTKTTPQSNPAGAGGYAVQVGAIPRKPSATELQEFAPLQPYGHIYNVKDGDLYKIRLGVYSSKNKASTVLNQVRAMPKFKSAFIVEEKNVDSSLLLDEVNKPLPGSGSVGKGGLYAVEVANQDASKPVVLERYANLSNLGNLYTKMENNRQSIRLGTWMDADQAAEAQRNVVKRGYPNALVVPEKGSDDTYQNLIITGAGSASPQGLTTPGGKKQLSATTTPVAGGDAYFVRLVALSQPERFDNNLLKGVGGTLEKKALSNGMTLLYLKGFSTIAEAETACDKARANGLSDAFVVEMRDGQLVRPRQ